MEHTVILNQFCLSDSFTFFIESFIFICIHWFIENFEIISYEIQLMKCYWMEIFRNNSNVPPPPVNRWPDFRNFQPSEFSLQPTYTFNPGGFNDETLMSSLTRLVMIGSRDHEIQSRGGSSGRGSWSLLLDLACFSQ